MSTRRETLMYLIYIQLEVIEQYGGDTDKALKSVSGTDNLSELSETQLSVIANKLEIISRYFNTQV